MAFTPHKFSWAGASTEVLPGPMDDVELKRLGLQSERDAIWASARKGLNKHESITNLELSPSKFNWPNAASTGDLPGAMKGDVLERNAVWASARKGLAKHESFKTNPEAFAWASVPHGGIAVNWGIKKTECKPFSFHERDQLTQEKKQAKIKMILEEEKKSSKFHARPLPGFYGNNNNQKGTSKKE